MRITYQDLGFTKKSFDVIKTANEIIGEYQADGYDLTLRQLYYQFVARGYIPNNVRQYKRLGGIVNNGRLAGMIDWNAITDRIRTLEKNSHWTHPAEIISACAKQYRLDTRRTQDVYIEVWVEKDALSGILDRVCTELDVPYLSCRGFVSQSAMWRASMRFRQQEAKNRGGLLLYLGDHDPSGLDMTRDVNDRLKMFNCNLDVERIALTMEQVEQYGPPPNPAKVTDSRYDNYVEQYGTESWELDALDPRVITELIEKAVGENTDQEARYKLLQEQKADRKELRTIANNLKGNKE
jgi:hypothetical protein